MRALLLILVLVTGCTHIYPTISKESFNMCWKLCKTHGGLSYVQSDIYLNYQGDMQKRGETCNCFNRQQFIISGE